jgi:hypothetical protein
VARSYVVVVSDVRDSNDRSIDQSINQPPYPIRYIYSIQAKILENIEKGIKVPQLDSEATEIREFLRKAVDGEGVDPNYEWVVKAKDMLKGPSRTSMRLG